MATINVKLNSFYEKSCRVVKKNKKTQLINGRVVLFRHRVTTTGTCRHTINCGEK